MIESGPLRPGTVSPNTNLSWDTRMWTAAAVVKPDTRVSDRYTTMKPTCRRPMASCMEQNRRLVRKDLTGHVGQQQQSQVNLENPHEEGH